MSTPARRLNRPTRGALVAAAVGLGLVLATARCLVPDPRGFGTHRQLGLATCGYLGLTGRRCPSCGLTTAMAWMVRGRVERAMAANPAGVLLAPSCAALVPWLLACAAAGRPCWGARTLTGPVIVVTVATGAVGLAAWTIRMLFGGS